jgi:hypothetical protein
MLRVRNAQQLGILSLRTRVVARLCKEIWCEVNE